MSKTLGEKLRQAREERGISISEVSEQTRISSLYLEAIEADNYKPLPGGIFNKGFVKSYAKFIGLDEHEALQDYARVVAETEGRESDPLRKYQPEVLTDDRASASMAPQVIFAVIILALGSALILLILNYWQGSPADPIAANNASNQNDETVDPVEKPAPKPAFDRIRLEFRALAEPISLTTNVDGRSGVEIVRSDVPKILEGSESVRVSYYRGFQDKVELTLNGKRLAPPEAPEKGLAIAFEINRANVEQVWQRGRIGDVPPAASPAPTATPQATTPKPTPTSEPTETPASQQSPTVTPSPVRTPTPAPPTPGRTPAAATPTPQPVATPTPGHF